MHRRTPLAGCKTGAFQACSQPQTVVTSGASLTVGAVACAQDVEATDTVLPVTYPQLHNMIEPGDTIYIGRYLVCGSDSASLYLEVLELDDQDIICEAKNGAVMDGLMTVSFETPGPGWDLCWHLPGLAYTCVCPTTRSCLLAPASMAY
jgi:pyruvate kinase